MLAVSLTVVLVLLGSGFEILPQALVISAFVAIWITYREFSKKKIWALYDNLGISRLPMFIVPTISLVVLGVILKMWI